MTAWLQQSASELIFMHCATTSRSVIWNQRYNWQANSPLESVGLRVQYQLELTGQYQLRIQDFRNGRCEDERRRREKFLGGPGHTVPIKFEFLDIWNAISSILGLVLSEILRKYFVMTNTLLFEKWCTSQYLYIISLSRMLFWPQTMIINASRQSPLYFSQFSWICL